MVYSFQDHLNELKKLEESQKKLLTKHNISSIVYRELVHNFVIIEAIKILIIIINKN